MCAFFPNPQNPAVDVNPFVVAKRGGGMGAVVALDAWGRPIIADYKPFKVPPISSFFGAPRESEPVATPSVQCIKNRDEYITMDQLEALEAQMKFEVPVADFVDPFAVRPVSKPTVPTKPVIPAKADVPPPAKADVPPPAKADVPPPAKADVPPPAKADVSRSVRADVPRSAKADVSRSVRAVVPRSVRADVPPSAHRSAVCSGCARCDRGASSAGCLIIVACDREMCILLGRSARDGTYSDLGGHLDDGERIRDTAAREVYEESARTIDIYIPHRTPYVDARPPLGRHVHRCYIVRKDDVQCRNFKQALKGHLPDECREMDRLTLFPVANLHRTLLDRGVAIDKDGKGVRLSSRAANVITMALNNRLL